MRFRTMFITVLLLVSLSEYFYSTMSTFFILFLTNTTNQYSVFCYFTKMTKMKLIIFDKDCFFFVNI